MALIKETETEGLVEIKDILPIQERWWNLHFDGESSKDGA